MFVNAPKGNNKHNWASGKKLYPSYTLHSSFEYCIAFGPSRGYREVPGTKIVTIQVCFLSIVFFICYVMGNNNYITVHSWSAVSLGQKIENHSRFIGRSTARDPDATFKTNQDVDARKCPGTYEKVCNRTSLCIFSRCLNKALCWRDREVTDQLGLNIDPMVSSNTPELRIY